MKKLKMHMHRHGDNPNPQLGGRITAQGRTSKADAVKLPILSIQKKP